MTFSTIKDGNIICADQSGGQVYDLIKELASSVEFHVEKPVKLVANVMDSNKGRAKVMVLLVSVQPAR